MIPPHNFIWNDSFDPFKSRQRWRPGMQLGITGPRKAIVPVCQGPLTRFSCPPAALAVAMATVALRNIAIPPLPPPSWALLPHMKLYPEAPHRLGGSAPCTAEPEGCSVGSVSSTDSTQHPGSAHPYFWPLVNCADDIVNGLKCFGRFSISQLHDSLKRNRNEYQFFGWNSDYSPFGYVLQPRRATLIPDARGSHRTRYHSISLAITMREVEVL